MCNKQNHLSKQGFGALKRANSSPSLHFTVCTRSAEFSLGHLATLLEPNEIGYSSSVATDSNPVLLATLHSCPSRLLGICQREASCFELTRAPRPQADFKSIFRCHQKHGKGNRGGKLGGRPSSPLLPTAERNTKGKYGRLALMLLWTPFCLGGPLIR